MASTSTPP
uniref:Uncharacterized protein n=1 Tax=Arundo donax TaxID=35708 RepID=A0A0A9CCG2_ARUDO